METLVHSKTAVLLKLLAAGPKYGKALIESIEEDTHGELVLKQGTIYPTLRELERELFIKSTKEYRASGGRPRIIYSLTITGRKRALLEKSLILKLMEEK